MFKQKLRSVDEPLLLKDWLLDAGSFMQRLKQHDIHDAKIKILNQHWALPTREERFKLGLAPRSLTLIREVLIHSNQQHWMVARTVFPQPIFTGKFRCLKNLKEKSLGSVLFKVPTLQRHFEIFQTKDNIMSDDTINTKNCWTRRSIFMLPHAPLLLTEIFLPALETLCVQR